MTTLEQSFIGKLSRAQYNGKLLILNLNERRFITFVDDRSSKLWKTLLSVYNMLLSLL